ncbi:hypothetical protein GP486_000450 [Trichoglossum hirsutum]|uniref:C2H2-type domain-containing protein n=1 Tax=Trichoglossum hirsutum TaxID=265104 RepID=A0A9P8RTY6_9PEZI|nr:hypothetical protein GP486_000450 [Trichoglossum hirsutum]
MLWATYIRSPPVQHTQSTVAANLTSGIEMTTLVRKPSPHSIGGGPSQPVRRIQASAGTSKRDTILYDAEDLKEFAYIYSHKGFDFDGSGCDQQTSVVDSVSALQRQQQLQQQNGSLLAAGAYSADQTPNSLLPIASHAQYVGADIPKTLNTKQAPVVSQHGTPTLTRYLPSVEESLVSRSIDEANSPIGRDTKEETVYLRPDAEESDTNRTCTSSPQQSASDATESHGSRGSSPIGKYRHCKGRRRRGRFKEWTKPDDNLASPSTSTLSRLFHTRSSLGLEPEDNVVRNPLSAAGSWIVKTGRRILSRSKLSRPSSSSEGSGSGGMEIGGQKDEPNILLPPSPPSSTDTLRQTTTPTNSNPSTDPSSRSPPPPSSTALSSPSSSLTALPHHDLDDRSPSPSLPGTLKPWQCTYCLQQLNGRSAWLDHEESHIRQVCNSEGYDGAMDDGNDDWFYSCGFCSVLLKTWLERGEHIGKHYANGTTMISWNPLASPYPVQRYDFSPVRGFPSCWSWEALLGAQRVGEEGRDVTEGHLEIRHRCRYCNINFPDATTAMRHTEIWHSRPTGFACPSLTAAQTPGIFFEQYDRDHDMCLLCGDLYPLSNWSRRTRHLKKVHGFSRCSQKGGFYREEQFVRHVANVHAVAIELLAAFVEGCKREETPPAWAAVGGRKGVMVI